MQPDAPLQAGLTLSIPKATLSANSASTFKPYDPSRVIGDANPALNALPVPQADDGGCGGFGQILMIAIAIVVTVYTAGAASGFVGTFAETLSAGAGALTGGAAGGAVGVAGSFGAGGSALGYAGTAALSAAAGSVASQAFGIAIGVQQDFSWQSVALSALSGGVSAGLAGFAPLGGDASPLANLVARAAVGSALTQGVSVAIGLQRSFSWQSVAASAIGAGVGESVGRELSGMGIDPFTGRVLTSAAASTATALARGGRVSITQIAVNAFGQSIGSSLAEQAMMGGTQEDRLTSLYNDGDLARSDLRFNSNAPSYHFATADGLDSGFTGTFGTALPRDSSNDLLVAGGDGFTLGRSNLVVSQSGRTTVIDGTGNPSVNSLLSQAKSLADELSAQAATARALNNLTGLAEAYRASGMSGATGDADVFPGSASTELQASSISESPGLLSRLGGIGQAYANGRVGFGDAMAMANGQIGGIGNVARDAVTGLANGTIDGLAFAASFTGPTPGDPLSLPRFGYTGRTGSLGPDIAMVAPLALGVRRSTGANGGVAVVEGAIPNAANAVIDPGKLTSYALNPAHPVGGNKAIVFDSALGYNSANADQLIAQIQQGVRTNPAVLGKVDQFGQRFTVDMPNTGPNGNTVKVRTGWILDPGATTPRLTTTYVK